jgi:hypothetical protein
MSQRTLNVVLAVCMVAVTVNYLWQSRKINKDSEESKAIIGAIISKFPDNPDEGVI